MPKITAQEFKQLSLRGHELLAGVPLHDAWAVDLPHTRSGITLNDFSRAEKARSCALPPAARGLMKFRLFVGRIFAWDREPAANAWETFASRLTSADLEKSLVPSGSRDGLFRVVYRFPNEQLLELANRTVHGAVLSALVETDNAYRFYMGIYVRNISRFTPVYMALIDPFRNLIVYPSLLRSVRANWNQAFGPA